MNYFFLFNTTTGEIHGSPYLGYVDEWTNIPDGCEVLGPFSEADADATVQAVFERPRDYIVQDGALVYRPDPNPPGAPPPTELELANKKIETLEAQLSQTNTDFQDFMTFFFENNPELA